jgi:NAD(P)-dependent dehydrogenase (short-subunit alcohol dehydrogenase family)
MLCTTVLRLSQTPTVGTFHAAGGKPWYNLFTPVGKLLLNKWFRKLDARIAVLGTVEQLDFASWRRVLSVNLDGAFLVVKHSVPLMKRQRGGTSRRTGAPTSERSIRHGRIRMSTACPVASVVAKAIAICAPLPVSR